MESTVSDEDDINPGAGAGTDRAGDEGADSLGDAGKKALDAMKGKWQTERDARKERDAEIAQLKVQLAKQRGADTKSDDKPDVDELRKQARAEARAEALQERALDRIEARAAKKFADPEDARSFLARRVKDFIDGDTVDTEAIDEALEDLLKKKPHLAAQGERRRFEAGADGGARKASKPDQLTRADLAKMTPQQIVKAQAEGRLADLMGS
jgi:hypothetical protein